MRPHSDRKLLHVLKSIERLSDTQYQPQRQLSLVTLDFQFSIRCRDRFNGILQGCLSWAKTLIWPWQGFICSFFWKLKRGEAAYRQLDRNNLSSPQIHQDRSFSKGWLGHLRLFGKGSPNKPCRSSLHILREVMSWVFWDVFECVPDLIRSNKFTVCYISHKRPTWSISSHWEVRTSYDQCNDIAVCILYTILAT